MIKKWKGKDWFNILSPHEFGAKIVGQTPSTDPKSLVGRTLEVGVPELTDDQTKYYMKINLRIVKVEGKTCYTSFNGMECTRDHLLRMVRKRNQKVETIVDIATKDGWLIRVKPWIILNGKPARSVETKVRHMLDKYFHELAKQNDIYELVKKIFSTEIQMTIKKNGSKIYPVRFSEIARIKVLKSPQFVITKPESEKKEEKTEEMETKKKSEKSENK